MSENIRRVILDTDMGTDDGLALLIFFYAMQMGLVKVEAIICTAGNTDRKNVVKNAVRMLEICNMTEIPVYKGARKQLILFQDKHEYYHGKDGFGDLVYDKEPDVSIVKDKPGAEAVYDLVRSNPKQISVICLGPLTNIALTDLLYDDFMDHVKDVWIMGGNYKGVGNVATGGSAEFNFFIDPESAYSILKEAHIDNPIHMLPWETCSGSNIPRSWWFDVLGKSNLPGMQLLTKAMEAVHKPTERFFGCCDAQLAMAFLYSGRAILVENSYAITVELQGSLTRGQGVVGQPRFGTPQNARIIEQVDYEFYKELLLNVGGLSDSLGSSGSGRGWIEL